ncbi:MAG: o-succinylbenzoate synthase [Akkermansiaceae bacterium]|nr:o-succinylbenzoate synthase [Akkermansiaceae bacterium]
MQLIDATPLMHFPHSFRLRWQRRVLHFKHPAATSRGALTERTTYIIEAETAQGSGRGECCIMPGLLPEPAPAELDTWCALVEKNQGLTGQSAPSPIQFGLECALLAALQPGKPRWDTPFARGEAGIPIHHLIWMDSSERMLQAMQQGIAAGFTCLKMKVGALPFDVELNLLQQAHASFPQAELRVDANGAFSPQEALQRLEALAAAGVSLIEQPIRPGQPHKMAELSRQSPLPIALDEELIGQAPGILGLIRPQAIVIKPSLHGGLLAAEKWAQKAEEAGIRWWVNSALESQVGLTALAEWCAYTAPGHMQALGKGNLFADDASGPIRLEGNCLKMQEI